MILRLSVLQQINLESVMRSQRGKDDEEMVTNFHLMQKIRVPKEEKVAYVRDIETPQGTIGQLIMRSITAAPDVDVELERAEFTRLQTVMREMSIGVDDYEWLIPLKDQISKINAGVAAVKPGKTKSKIEEVA